MPFPDRFATGDVLLDIEARGRRALIETLAAEAAQRADCAPEPVLDALLAREALGSTALGRGIAMPHAAVAEARSPAILFARLRRPVEFEARDGEPVDLVVLVIWPAAARAGLLGAMGRVAGALRDPVLPRRLRQAATPEEVVALLSAAMGAED